MAMSLLRQGHEVAGTTRNIHDCQRRLEAVGISDQVRICRGTPLEPKFAEFVRSFKPDFVYHLSGVTSVSYSFANPGETYESIVEAFVALLHVVGAECPRARVFNAGSGDAFGEVPEGGASEETAPSPKSPYGAAKAATREIGRSHRMSGLFVSTGIMFNHESPLRGENFVTSKIVRTARKIASGSPERLTLGNLDVERDWGWALDYVDAMQKIVALREPNDFVLATGYVHSLTALVEAVFRNLGLDWRDHVAAGDPSLVRRADLRRTCGDAGFARKSFAWNPIDFEQLTQKLATTAGPTAI